MDENTDYTRIIAELSGAALMKTGLKSDLVLI